MLPVSFKRMHACNSPIHLIPKLQALTPIPPTRLCSLNKPHMAGAAPSHHSKPSQAMAGMMQATVILVAAVVLSEAWYAAGDIAADRADCAENLVGLSTCLEYVEGSARAPTPDCCRGLEKVRVEKPRCLCVLIKDHDNPELAVKINVTLAISLPSVCHVPANISHCPKLLNLPPGSKDAEIFNQPGALAAQGNGSSSASRGSHTTGNTVSQANSGGAAAFLVGCEGAWLLRWLGLEMLGGIWIISLLSIPVAFC